ncbi:MAG: helix-turn-helix transcriptional regulator [Myxococcota bacterium]|nr:helix-turn-helix transcriptional regulator [Myxococcota bacterium]
MDFTPRDDLSPGRTFYETRAKLGISLEACSSRTRIPAKSLRALEHDNWAALPAPVYVKGFIKAYATELGLDPDPLISAWREVGGERQVEPYVVSTPQFMVKPPAPRIKGSTLSIAAGVAVGAAVLAFWLLGAPDGRQAVLGQDAGVSVEKIQQAPMDNGSLQP